VSPLRGWQINPALAAANIRVIKDTHGRTSHLVDNPRVGLEMQSSAILMLAK
jgi:hypothetical protein